MKNGKTIFRIFFFDTDNEYTIVASDEDKAVDFFKKEYDEKSDDFDVSELDYDEVDEEEEERFYENDIITLMGNYKNFSDENQTEILNLYHYGYLDLKKIIEISNKGKFKIFIYKIIEDNVFIEKLYNAFNDYNKEEFKKLKEILNSKIDKILS